MYEHPPSDAARQKEKEIPIVCPYCGELRNVEALLGRHYLCNVCAKIFIYRS